MNRSLKESHLYADNFQCHPCRGVLRNSYFQENMALAQKSLCRIYCKIALNTVTKSLTSIGYFNRCLWYFYNYRKVIFRLVIFSAISAEVCYIILLSSKYGTGTNYHSAGFICNISLNTATKSL